jgi:tetratricopeptide (TPR) repeat protein
MKLEKQAVRYPRAFDAGVAVDLVPSRKWDQTLTVSAALAAVSHLSPTMAFGIEYTMQDRLCLRAGLRDGEACFGAGLRYQAISFDYALLDRDPGNIHTFSVSAALGVPVSEKRRVREEKRETEFNKLLESRLGDQNREAVAGLVDQAERLMAGGHLAEASTTIDRALLLTEGGQVDASTIYAKAQELRASLDAELARVAFAAYMDSIEDRMGVRDYLGARYFAELALAQAPDSAVAGEVLAKVDIAIEQGTTASIVFEGRLGMADSLVTYGEYEKALAIARGLAEDASEDSRVLMVIRRAEFGYWQDVARTALSRGDYARARAAADSALSRFPEHPACLGLRAQIDREMQARKTAPASTVTTRSAPIDAAVMKDVEGAYQSGQGLFEKGRLADAVTEWEKVEALAPNYQSVRTYLVNAYKYLGVELYTQNSLQEAIDVWKKAARLAPDNTEIANYIRRTEGEMARLRELSYERR